MKSISRNNILLDGLAQVYPKLKLKGGKILIQHAIIGKTPKNTRTLVIRIWYDFHQFVLEKCNYSYIYNILSITRIAT